MLGVEALQRAQQADDALLHELTVIDRGIAAVEPRDAADQRHEALDQPLSVLGVLTGSEHEAALGLRWEAPRRAGAGISSFGGRLASYQHRNTTSMERFACKLPLPDLASDQLMANLAAGHRAFS
jgi:hypothetical protein